MKNLIYLFVLVLVVASCSQQKTSNVEAVSEPLDEFTATVVEVVEIPREPKKMATASTLPVPTAIAVIDGESYTLNVFETGGKLYTMSAELSNGLHNMTSFIYNDHEYLEGSAAFITEDAQVKQFTLINSQPGIRSGEYSPLPFGYNYFEFEEPDDAPVFTTQFHTILGVLDSILPFYEGSNYEYQPAGIQPQMKCIFLVQYYQDGVKVATYGQDTYDYSSGAVNVTYTEGNNMFKIQHYRWLPGAGGDGNGAMVGVVGMDYAIYAPLNTGDNGIVNVQILPATWPGTSEYLMYYTN